jgi:hypothetical protein
MFSMMFSSIACGCGTHGNASNQGDFRHSRFILDAGKIVATGVCGERECRFAELINLFAGNGNKPAQAAVYPGSAKAWPGFIDQRGSQPDDTTDHIHACAFCA